MPVFSSKFARQQAEYDRRRYVKDKPAILARVKKWKQDNKEKVNNRQHPYLLMWHYGMSIEEFRTLARAQRGRCAICRRLPEKACKRKKRLSVDHNHKTKKVRGLLCDSCNKGLGLFTDSPALLLKAAAYLRKAS